MTKDNSKKHSSVNNCTTDGDKDRKNSHDCCQVYAKKLTVFGKLYHLLEYIT